jgi:hypothetical protein
MTLCILTLCITFSLTILSKMTLIIKDTQFNNTQHCDTLNNDTELANTQHNDTQHNQYRVSLC